VFRVSIACPKSPALLNITEWAKSLVPFYIARLLRHTVLNVDYILYPIFILYSARKFGHYIIFVETGYCDIFLYIYIACLRILYKEKEKKIYFQS